MSDPSKTWRTDLMERHSDLFRGEIGGRYAPEGYPTVGNGWRELLETALLRIEAALHGAPSGSLSVVQIKEKYGSLRLYWESHGLSAVTVGAIEEAVALAEARSACTCETCGEVGRLYSRGGWYHTACDEHGQGKVRVPKPGWDDVHVTMKPVGGKLRVVRCRRYIRESDTFVDVPPFSLGIKE